MVEIRWIKMTLFVILLLLQFTAASGQTLSSVTTRAGDNATLSCNNVNQDKCKSTTWLHSRSGETAKELVDLGRINVNVISKAKSSRLGLTADCSLVIRNVTAEDVGVYTCRQFISGQKQGPDARVVLSVINMEGTNTTDTVSLFCTVLTYDQCEHTVEWLYEGDKSDVETSQHICSATVTLLAPHLCQKLKYYELLKCKVTDNMSVETLLSNVGVCEKTGSTSVGKNNTSSAKNDTPTKPEWWMWLIIVFAGLAALLIITVAVIRWKRTKGNTTQMDERIGLSLNHAVTPPGPETSHDMADPEDGVSYASVSYTKKTNAKAQVRVKDDDDDDAVTYSTVKSSSSSPSDL
ncbi:uncharacterized protein LOC129106765 [Anoplopoma fimbria]|uniref:uncharacterized protein LOC129106765 n=1 Tax=Anoplopoma fimbria TaxID=229290 RepID=UPI0023EB5070|nr:uncharacterized protein LOC129106765 [Anoplopoma fimbria]